MPSTGKFMVINGIACLILLKLALSGGVPGGAIGLGLVVYFWGSLWLYGDWYNMHAPLHGMKDSQLWDLEQEWIGGGPFGRSVPALSRLRQGQNPARYAQALDRMAEIYSEYIRRNPDDVEQVKNWTRLRDQALSSKRGLKID